MMIMIEIIVEVLCNLVSCGARPFKAQVHLHSGVGCWLVQVFSSFCEIPFSPILSNGLNRWSMVCTKCCCCFQCVAIFKSVVQRWRWEWWLLPVAGRREGSKCFCLSFILSVLLCFWFVIVFLPSLCLFVFVCKEWIYAKGLSCGQCRLSSTRFMFPKFNNIWVNLIICFGLEVKAVLWSFRVLSLSVWFNIDHRHLSLLLIYRRWAVSKGDRDKVLEWYGVVFW